MRLIQARVRCVAGVRDSGWFVPGRKTTVLYGEPGSGKTALLRALQTLNPPYAIERLMPLADHPETWQQQGHSRRVIPGKKTAVCMVFSAKAEQIPLLEKIDPALFETDRIEVGRRLDHSRWTTFVEIAASARWADIRKEMTRLQEKMQGRIGLPEFRLAGGLRENDRLKGEIGSQCLKWLQAIAPLVPSELAATHAVCLTAVERRERFYKAEQQVAEWLPLTLHLCPEDLIADRFLPDIANGDASAVAAQLARTFLQMAGNLGQDVAAARFASMREDNRPLTKLFSDQGLEGYPDLQWLDNELLIGQSPRNECARRCWYIGTVCQLAGLVRDGRPLLLFDGFDAGLQSKKKTEMMSFLQRLGEWCQVLAATSDRLLAKQEGWHTCLSIGAKTLEQGGRVNVMT